MKDKYHYICNYCYEEFVPKRRKVQKYCSNTCRSKAWQENNSNKSSNKNSLTMPVYDNTISNIPKQEGKVNKMSFPGIANAALGNVAADAIKSILTPDNKKPATKADINDLLERLDIRYHYIKNLPQDDKGRYPFFDLQEGMLVYIVTS
ncbi:hypothetical protein [Winogradskyella haliclonae]|uniref:Uncharacterized protein n=1 Tax=Winogradskyella haliclonae TaxID=2048558 RepID=A0ABQ2C148_9FLAO|nr:hypothetical protein [Winogradskyella haliclonae]GGI56858.1 hypothetical protein GCM10011444_11670 [Winogradskyella haliclonae]